MRVQQFCTYSLLVSGSGAAQAAGGKKGKATPASMVKPGSRIKQLIDWLAPGRDDDGGSSLIVFDECHKAKNLINSAGEPTKTALAVVAIQEALSGARVLYCSATGASEPKNLAYMTRMGLFGYKDFSVTAPSPLPAPTPPFTLAPCCCFLRWH